jgi:hypothetical protein
MVTYTVDPSRQVPRHFQDAADGCGPACVQMIVDSMIGAGVGLIDQVAIRKATASAQPKHKLKHRFATTPEGLAKALNTHCPQEWQQWEARYFDTEHKLLAAIMCALKQSGTPAIVTQNMTDHWTVVTSVSVESGGMVRVQGWDPARLLQPVTPHFKGDDCSQQVSHSGDVLAQLARQANGGTWAANYFDTFVELEDGGQAAVGVIFGTCDSAAELDQLMSNTYEQTGMLDKRVALQKPPATK